MSSKSQPYALRLDNDLADKFEAYYEAQQEAAPNEVITRSQALRTLVAYALDESDESILLAELNILLTNLQSEVLKRIKPIAATHLKVITQKMRDELQQIYDNDEILEAAGIPREN